MPAGSPPSAAPRVVGLDRASRYRRAMQSLTIRAEDGRLMPMRFTDSQEIFWSHVAPKLNRHAPLWFIVLKARQVYCLDPKTRVLTADLRWMSLEDIQVGQKVVSVDEEPPGGKGPSRMMRSGDVIGVREVYEPAFELLMSNGERLVATAQHRFLTYRAGRACWRPVSALHVGHSIRSIVTPWGAPDVEDGWFGGLLDGEGHLPRKRSGALVGVSQVAGPVLDRALDYLKSRGYAVGVSWDVREPGTSKFGAQPVCRLQLTRMTELFRLVGQARPVRFISRLWWEGQELPGKGIVQETWPTIVAKVALPLQRMLDLSTTTGTFIAEGFVSHNSSTFTAALTFIRTLERGGANSLVVAHDLDTSHDLFNMAKRFYDHLPLPKIRPPKVKELEFSLPDGVSRYRVVSAGTMSKGRGTTQTCMHLSEVAFWPHPEVLTGMAQALPHLADTILVIESTANGVAGQGEMFHDLWQAAVRGESDYTPIFIPWWTMQKYRRQPAIPPDEWDDEERLLAAQFGVDGEQIQWRRRKIATDLRGVVDMFRQEFPASADESFVVSGIPAFDTLAVLSQRSSIRDPLWRGTFLDGKPTVQDKGEVRVWAEPIASHEYVIGADTAEGVVDRGGTTSDRGGDYACAEVLDAATCEQVASVHGRIPPYEFAVLLNQLGRYYNRATLCIEVYPQGHRVQDHLIREFYYPNLHRWRGKPDRIRSAPARLYGWETSVWSRPLMIGAGQRWINDKLLVIHEDGLLKELLHFSKNDDGKYEAQFGHDDRVMALLLALRSREENYVERHAMPVLSDPGFVGPMRGVRVADAGVFETTVGPDGKLTSSADASRRVHRILRDRARAAVNAYVTRGDKTWMTL